MFLIYAIVQIGEYQAIAERPTIPPVDIGAVKTLTTIIPVVIAVSQAAYIGLGWRIYNEFGWKVYKFLGADRQIKKMYASYQVFECLVKFDVFFWAGFSVQFIWLVLDDSQWEFYVTVAALPVSILLLFEGHLAARHENKWMMATFMSGCACAMIYFAYKVSTLSASSGIPTNTHAAWESPHPEGQRCIQGCIQDPHCLLCVFRCFSSNHPLMNHQPSCRSACLLQRRYIALSSCEISAEG